MSISKTIRILCFSAISLLIFSCNEEKAEEKEIRKGNLTIEAYLQIDTAKPYLQQVIRYDSLNKRIETTWYDAEGKGGRVSKPVYNTSGQMISDERITTASKGKVSKEIWKYNYKEKGLVSEVFYILNGDTMDTEYIYDSEKRLQKEISAKSTGVFWKGTKTYLYENDKLVKILSYEEDGEKLSSCDSIVYNDTGKVVHSVNYTFKKLSSKEITVVKKGKTIKEFRYAVKDFFHEGPDTPMEPISETSYTYNNLDSMETKSKTRLPNTEWCGVHYPAKNMTYKYVYIWK